MEFGGLVGFVHLTENGRNREGGKEREGRRGREREDPDPIMSYPETCPEQRPVDDMQASQWIMHKDSIVPLWSIRFGFGVWLQEGQITPALPAAVSGLPKALYRNYLKA